MNYSKNNNGYNLTVEPIRKTKDIRSISRMLKSKPRNYLLWIMGINDHAVSGYRGPGGL